MGGKFQKSRHALIKSILSKDLKDVIELVMWIYGEQFKREMG